MRAYPVPSGNSIEKAAAQIVVLANRYDDQVAMTFNGVELFANPGDSPDGIVDKYYTERDRLHAERALIDRAVRMRNALALEIYCRETAGDMDVRDFWHKLPPHVQEIYQKKAEKEADSRYAAGDYAQGEFLFEPRP